MPIPTPPKVALLGENHTYRPPPFADRSELLAAIYRFRDRDDAAIMRIMSATVGMCTRLGERSGVSYVKSGCDVLTYGGAVYGWLHEQGAGDGDIVAAASVLLDAVKLTHFPTQDEVREAVGNSDGAAG